MSFRCRSIMFDFVETYLETCIQELALILSYAKKNNLSIHGAMPVMIYQPRECQGEKIAKKKGEKKAKSHQNKVASRYQHDISKTLLPNPRLFCFCRAPKARPEPALLCTGQKMPISYRDVVTDTSLSTISRPFVKNSFRCRYQR